MNGVTTAPLSQCSRGVPIEQGLPSHTLHVWCFVISMLQFFQKLLGGGREDGALMGSVLEQTLSAESLRCLILKLSRDGVVALQRRRK